MGSIIGFGHWVGQTLQAIYNIIGVMACHPCSTFPFSEPVMNIQQLHHLEQV